MLGLQILLLAGCYDFCRFILSTCIRERERENCALSVIIDVYDTAFFSYTIVIVSIENSLSVRFPLAYMLQGFFL
jgi:hypothetical protein